MHPESISNPKSESWKDLKIGVLLGGRSSERRISKKSGKAVALALKRLGIPVICLDPGNAETFHQRLNQIDVAFIALHGQGGEDGQIQMILERKKIPYIGSSPEGCRLSFDKILSKKIFRQNGIPTPSYKVLNPKDWKTKMQRMNGLLFVKPPREGSSIGAFSVESIQRQAAKIRRHIARYGKLIAEAKIVGREFTVGILGSRPLPVIELKPKHGFYDYHCKYTKGMTDYEVPARIPASLKQMLQKLALRVHQTLKLRDFSRVDFMVDQDGRPFVLEANAIPGFTELSLLPKAAKEAGISFEALCLELVRRACLRSVNLRLKKRC